MHPDLDALLAAVRADPGDDVARLVLADWLEERERAEPCRVCSGVGETWVGGRGNGDRYNPPRRATCPSCDGAGTESNRMAARAEFIRVQIELARMPQERADRLNDETDWSLCDTESGIAASWCPNCGDCSCPEPEHEKNHPDCPLHGTTSLHCCLTDIDYREAELRRREAELHDALGYHMVNNPAPFPVPVILGGTDRIVMRRGFIAGWRLAFRQVVEYLPLILANPDVVLEEVWLTDPVPLETYGWWDGRPDPLTLVVMYNGATEDCPFGEFDHFWSDDLSGAKYGHISAATEGDPDTVAEALRRRFPGHCPNHPVTWHLPADADAD